MIVNIELGEIKEGKIRLYKELLSDSIELETFEGTSLDKDDIENLIKILSIMKDILEMEEI